MLYATSVASVGKVRNSSRSDKRANMQDYWCSLLVFAHKTAKAATAQSLVALSPTFGLIFTPFNVINPLLSPHLSRIQTNLLSPFWMKMTTGPYLPGRATELRSRRTLQQVALAFPLSTCAICTCSTMHCAKTLILLHHFLTLFTYTFLFTLSVS